jgi:dimethylaniline monooxygenase (N-oxide forming)
MNSNFESILSHMKVFQTIQYLLIPLTGIMAVIEQNSYQHVNATPSSSCSSPTRSLKALVIGAGPSGLVTAKYLLSSTNPRYEVTILEASDAIGGTFVNKVYDHARLVSSKYITGFSDFRMKEDYPDHPSAADYVQYLDDYARTFGIIECIKFGCRVVSLKDDQCNEKNYMESTRTGNVSTNDETENSPLMTKRKGQVHEEEVAIDSNGYTVSYHDTRKSSQPQDHNEGHHLITEHFDVVAVCSGLHNVPSIPTLPSSSKFRGQIIHSSQYKESSIFTNKRVLVLGSGETAMDIALRAIQNPQSRSVALNVRRGFLSIPHNLAEDRPLDVFITNLFEHSYEHPWVHKLRLRWVLSTIVIRLFLFLTGSSVGFNQWACETTPIKRGYHIINKSHEAMSHLNVPIKQQSTWGKFWLWIYGEAKLRPMASFHRTSVCGIKDDGVTVVFDDGREYEADLIVLATGYKQSFPFLDEAIQEDHRLTANVPKEASKSKYFLEEDYLPSDHFIVNKKRPRLGFIGFVRPNVGASKLFQSIRLGSRKFILDIIGRSLVLILHVQKLIFHLSSLFSILKYLPCQNYKSCGGCVA